MHRAFVHVVLHLPSLCPEQYAVKVKVNFKVY